LVGNERIAIKVAKESTVASIYEEVKKYSSHPSDFNRFTPGQCSYYKLKALVPFSYPIDEVTLDRCHDQSNWKEIDKHARVGRIFEDPQDEYIHMILLFPTGQFSASQFERVLKVSHRSNSRHRRDPEARSSRIV
jgi:hypothetical protein